MTKAGVRLEVLLNATTRRDEKGDIIGVVGIGQDITGRIAQEREYSKLIDSANAPILGKVNIWNQCAVKLVGYTTKEVMGQSLVQAFMTPDHRERIQSVIDRALAGNETTNFEFSLTTKGGIRLEVLLNATTSRIEQDSIISVVGIGQDVYHKNILLLKCFDSIFLTSGMCCFVFKLTMLLFQPMYCVPIRIQKKKPWEFLLSKNSSGLNTTREFKMSLMKLYKVMKLQSLTSLI